MRDIQLELDIGGIDHVDRIWPFTGVEISSPIPVPTTQ